MNKIICEVTNSKLETLKKKKPEHYWAYHYVSNENRFSGMLHRRFQINYGTKYSHKDRILDGDKFVFERIDTHIGTHNGVECLQPGICILYKNDNITGCIISKDLNQIYDKIENDGIDDIENSYVFHVWEDYCHSYGYNLDLAHRDLKTVKQMIKRYLIVKNML
jgi:hypothetical protein